MKETVEKPARFGITNRWLIGKILKYVVDGEIEYILAAFVAQVRGFENVYSHSAGAHQTRKGHHVSFVHDPEYVGKSFEFMLQ